MDLALLADGSKTSMTNTYCSEYSINNLGFVVPCIFNHSNKTPN